jgi:mannose-6-phosphate isomerase-like protein (cupin superfamily)
MPCQPSRRLAPIARAGGGGVGAAATGLRGRGTHPAMAYDIHTDEKYAPLEVIDAGALADACRVPWWNQTLCRVNESVARIGVFLGEFHWHKHDREDELFFVLDGRLLLDIEGKGTFELGPRQGMMVPRGVVHRTRAAERTVVLMVEPATVVPTGD